MSTALVLKEADIQRTICDFLRAEQWRIFELEQQWSDKKLKTVGEQGMPDILAIRYLFAGRTRDFVSDLPLRLDQYRCAEVMWIEVKRRMLHGRATKPTPAQLAWHSAERARGALTLIAGLDFEASIEGFMVWYKSSGLAR